MDKTDNIVYKCIVELFKRVGLKYPCPRLTKHRDWYMRKSWTIEKEAKYKIWLKKKLKKAFPYMRERQLNFEVCMFLLQYSWKYKETK